MGRQLKSAETPLLTLRYANGAEISRLNKGLKRRKEKKILGFGINPQTGAWVAAPGDDIDDGTPQPDAAKSVRIVPIVKDNKNALHLRFLGHQHSAATLATVQHALLRGIELVHQLEEGEVLGEPLPARDNHRALLLYEATEGGAGVLARLLQEKDALARVSRHALGLMHLQGIDEAISENDPSRLTDQPHANCLKGCYRCLLSYYNQPDHELIDRTDPDARALLIAMARGEVQSAPSVAQDSADPWLAAFKAAGFPPPDARPLTLGGVTMTYAWRAQLVALSPTPIPDSASAGATDKGYTLLALLGDPASGVPLGLADLLKD